MTLWGSAVQIRSSLPVFFELQALSSAGRALPSHGRGQRFDPVSAYHDVHSQRGETRVFHFWRAGDNGSPGGNSHDHAARRLDAEGPRGDEPARDRRRHRPAPGQGRPGREDRRQGRGPRGPRRARREGRDRDAEVARRPRALPPFDGAPDGQRGQAPLPDGADRHRPGDRERLLLRLQPGAALHAGGPRGDRSGDEEDRRRGQPGRAARDVQGRGRPDLRGPERQAEGRDHPRHPGRPRLLLPPEGLHRSLPRPARAVHGQARRLQADAHGGRLLEGRREEPDAPADLRRLLPHAEGARRAPEAAGGGAGPRPPQARQGARPLLVPSARAGFALLPPEGRDPLQRPDRVPARGVPAPRLRGGRDAADLRRRALQDLRPLRQLQREHVLHGGRGARVRRQADELPGPLPALPDAPVVLPGPAGAVRRLRAAPPLRALRRDRGPDARALVLAGRRAHLHAAREGRVRDLPLPRVRGRGLRDVRVHGRRDLARPAPGEAHRRRRAVGPRRSGARRPRSRRPGARTS